MQDGYGDLLNGALDHWPLVLIALVCTIALNVWLIAILPKGFFPLEDTGRMTGSIQADQDISFQSMSRKLQRMIGIIHQDPAIDSVVGFTGVGSGGAGGQTNTGSVYISLKPKGQRDSIDAVMSRLRRKLGRIPGARLFLQPVQDIRVGGRQSNALYQYSVLGDSTAQVYQWAPRLMAAMEKDPTFVDVSSDQQLKGGETLVTADRTTGSRLGVTMYQVDNNLYDAFGQRAVSTIYSALNQYRVVMEVAPPYWQRPETLDRLWVSTSGAQPAGSALTQLSAGSVTAPARPTGPAAIPPATPLTLSSWAATATNIPTVPAANPTVVAPNPVGPTANTTVLGAGATATTPAYAISPAAAAALATTSSTAAAAAVSATAANNAVRTSLQSTLGSTGSASTSTAAAVATSVETMIPFPAFASYAQGQTPLSVNHQSQFVATTISFNLAPGKSLSQAQTAIARASQRIGLPGDLVGGFSGTALVFQQSLKGEALLIIAALIAIYIVLGVLYESFIHPLTIMSTLPSAGVGAMLALMLFGIQFTIIALIGVVLLIGIVKKNAIMMIDFALKAERDDHLESREAIHRAAVIRFRPIMMTTTAAMLGALPLCFTFGTGSELRQPLGITIVGGLLVSQVLTLFTTPVVYLALDRLAHRVHRTVRRRPRGAS
jgi:multidrug efflux pump subunit AcrB